MHAVNQKVSCHSSVLCTKIEDTPLDPPKHLTQVFDSTASSNHTTASGDTFLLALEWMRSCRENYPGCRNAPRAVPELPTRLVDVGPSDGSQNPKLVIPSRGDRAVEYLTLSHCWGGADIYKLTSDTFSTLLSGLSLETLSKTFKDAIFITRCPGFRYIWIDSLCIFQDSPSDWDHEGACMVSVYRNSICTIAALESVDGNGGFLAQRSPSLHQPCRLLDDWHYSPLFGAEKPERALWCAPLISRAWVMQEVMLSPRTLYYGKTLIWECREYAATESRPMGIPYNVFAMGQKDLFNKLRVSRNLESNWNDQMDFIASWSLLVEEYTK